MKINAKKNLRELEFLGVKELVRVWFLFSQKKGGNICLTCGFIPRIEGKKMKYTKILYTIDSIFFSRALISINLIQGKEAVSQSRIPPFLEALRTTKNCLNSSLQNQARHQPWKGLLDRLNPNRYTKNQSSKTPQIPLIFTPAPSLL